MKKGIIGITILGAGLMLVGSYTTMSINSEDFMNDNEIKFVKRLDELNGNVVRSVASIKPMNLNFDNAPKSALVKINQAPQRNLITRVKNFFGSEKSEAPKVKAAIMQELDLALTEVYSPKKYSVPLTKEQFEGSLRANNGIIENMDVRLPGDGGLSISNVEMNGNMFSCNIGGEKYSGMIFTTDNKSFMVSFTEGAMEGTRFKFDTTTPTVEEAQNDIGAQPEVAVENQDVNSQGGFEQANAGQPQVAPRVDINPQDPSFDQVAQQDQVQAPVNGQESAQLSAEQVEESTQNQGFNFNQEQAI